MKFDIYGRFQLDVKRENNAWVVYRSESGKRARLNDVVLPEDLTADELAIYLDDLFHEFAGSGESVRIMPD